jgi:hypothetical protein
MASFSPQHLELPKHDSGTLNTSSSSTDAAPVAHSSSFTNTDLRSTLNDVDLLIGFKAFLDKQFCTENLFFWMEVEVYHKIRDPKPMVHRANEIWHKYFSSESTYELNLPSQFVEDIAKELEKQQPNPQLFEKAQKVVYTMMEQDAWFRYVQTPEYRHTVEGNILTL